MTTAGAHSEPPRPEAKPSTRDAIVDALMRLAARRDFADVTISDIAREAGVSIADFRDCFPSKGAAFGAFMRRIDRKVLEGLPHDYSQEPARERLYDVLRRRLEAIEPHRHALDSIKHWVMSDPLAASALNRELMNSMRFMMEAADIDCEGTVGAVKLQGLTLAFARVQAKYLDDGDMDRALTSLDRELGIGEKLVDRAEDVARLTQPFFSLAERLFGSRRRGDHHSHHRDGEYDHDHDHEHHHHPHHPHAGA